MNICYYCGAPADTLDHVPPKCVRPLMLSDQKAFGQYKFIEVPCCWECNVCFLGSKGWTLSERKRIVYSGLIRKYKTVLEMPNWSEKEIESMGFGMQTQIREQLALKSFILKRLQWRPAHISTESSTPPEFKPSWPSPRYPRKYNRKPYSARKDERWGLDTNGSLSRVKHAYFFTCIGCGKMSKTSWKNQRWCGPMCRANKNHPLQKS